MKKISVVFCATPDIALPCLEYLSKNPAVDLKLVVTPPDRPSGRGKQLSSPAVAQKVKELGLNLLQTENINQEEDFFDSLGEIDLIIVFAFSQFLSTKILNRPKIGCFNIHASLLPAYRGAAPIQYTILNGEQTTGITIQKMAKKMDTGDVVIKLPFSINEKTKSSELYFLMKNKAPEALDKFIFDVQNENLSYHPQNHALATFAPSLQKKNGYLDFKNKKRQDLIRQVLAFDLWPGTYCFAGKKRLKVFEVEFSSMKLLPGQTDCSLGMLIVGTLNGSLRLVQIQLEGKKTCLDIELIKGLRDQLIINP